VTAAPTWYFDESQIVGVDYADLEIARSYDAHMLGLGRDSASQTRRILEKLGLDDSARIIDLGCGTGLTAVEAARCQHVYAVDVSRAMLDVLRDKTAQLGLGNISLHQAGFLTYRHADPPVDAVVTLRALHHLPDFWKLIALQRVAEMLVPSGQLYLTDFVYSFDSREYTKFFDSLVGGLEPAEAANMAALVREEYATFDWVMEGLFHRAGFEVIDAALKDGHVGEYHCRKTGSR
jgi:cyclopropane fatty-acyl-phospholipid synthase-like methyltransferase